CDWSSDVCSSDLDVSLSHRDVVITAGIGSPRIGAIVSEACGQGQIWIYGQFRCSNRVERISRFVMCVTLHQVKIELSIGNGRPGWNTGKIKLHQNHIGNLVVWPGVEVESG